ncbi:MAG: hypothetical protein R6V03_08665 [Kiritimatiellia bacterium]
MINGRRIRATSLVARTTAVCAALITAAAPCEAATRTWDGGADPDENWSTGGIDGNWSGEAAPGASDDVIFNDTDESTEGDINSVVDSDRTIDSLNFRHRGQTSTDFHTVEIPAGVTLAIDGDNTDQSLDANTDASLLVGGFKTNDVVTRAAITGGGKLLVNGTRHIRVGHTGQNGVDPVALLDLSGLAEFEVTMPSYDLLVGMRNEDEGDLLLAATNTITVDEVYVGYSILQGSSGSEISLGQRNTLNTDDIYLGYQKSTGKMSFNTGTFTDGEITMRAKDGVGRVSDVYAAYVTGGTGVSCLGDYDFRGGTVDLLINRLWLCRAENNNWSTGYFRMDGGTADVWSVSLGRSDGNNGPRTGQIDLEGGTFIANSITMGHDGASNPSDEKYAIINFSNGALLAGTIQKGTEAVGDEWNRVLNWSGGTLSVENWTVGTVVTQDNTSAVSTLSPGGSGTIATNSFNDDYVLTGGAWYIEIDRTSGNSDKVEISGELDLSGADDTLNILGLNGVPQVGKYTIAACGSISGSFDAANFPSGVSGSVTCDGGDVIVSIVPSGTLFLVK